jgi:hypothetical protein
MIARLNETAHGSKRVPDQLVDADFDQRLGSSFSIFETHHHMVGEGLVLEDHE